MAGIRRKVALGQYELTAHAKDELEQDGFVLADLKEGIYSGTIIAIQQHGRSRRKYAVKGKTAGGRVIHVICRLTDLGTLRVITVYGQRR